MEPLIKATPDMRTPLYTVKPFIKAAPDMRTPLYTVKPLIKATPDMRTPLYTVKPLYKGHFAESQMHSFSTTQLRPLLYIKDKISSPMVATISIVQKQKIIKKIFCCAFLLGVCNRWTGELDWSTGLEHWTGVLEHWNTGVHY